MSGNNQVLKLSPEDLDAIKANIKKQIDEAIKSSCEETQKLVNQIGQNVLTGKGNKEKDSYRTTIHFLAGSLTFCLGMFAAIFNALANINFLENPLIYEMLGVLLAYIGASASVATIIAVIVQCLKFKDSFAKTKIDASVIGKAILMFLAAFFGLVAATYCIRYGYAIQGFMVGVGELGESLKWLVKLD